MNPEVKTDAPNELTSSQFWSKWSDQWTAQSARRRARSGLRGWVRSRLTRHTTQLYRKLCELTGRPDGDLLEIGCGYGIVLAQMHEACPRLRLHGIDYSEAGLTAARQKLHDAGIEATLHLGDAFTTELPEKYDIVFSGGVIEHFVDPQAIVNRHRDLCKPGGHVVITVPNIRPWPHRVLLKQFDPEVFAAHNLDTLRTNRLRELMLAAQLEDVQVGKAGPPWLYPGAASGRPLRRLYIALAALWNLMVHLPPFPPLWRTHLWAVGRVPAAGRSGAIAIDAQQRA